MIFTRRTDTVTTSVPETSMALFVSAKSLYFPVPTQRRDLNSMPAMTSLSSVIFSTPRIYSELRTPNSEPCRPAGHKTHHLNIVAFRNGSYTVPVFFHDLPVQLNRDTLRLYLQNIQETEDRNAIRDLSLLAIQRNIHFRSSLRRCQS